MGVGAGVGVDVGVGLGVGAGVDVGDGVPSWHETATEPATDVTVRLSPYVAGVPSIMAASAGPTGRPRAEVPQATTRNVALKIV